MKLGKGPCAAVKQHDKKVEHKTDNGWTYIETKTTWPKQKVQIYSEQILSFENDNCICCLKWRPNIELVHNVQQNFCNVQCTY